MVKIRKDLIKQNEEYKLRHRKFEMIDSVILQLYGQKFNYLTNELDLHTNIQSGKTIKKMVFATDLVYISSNPTGESVLFVEETSDPANKADQLEAYGNISPQTLKLITYGDVVPSYDVFLIIPPEAREMALELFERIKPNIKDLGNTKGISLWTYCETTKVMKCVGGIFSKFTLPLTVRKEIKSKGFGRFPILKNPSIIFLMQHIIKQALHFEYGKFEEKIEFDEEKLSKWLSKSQIINKALWKEALKFGREVGIFEDVSLEQFCGKINYTKAQAASIKGAKKVLSEFYNFMETSKDSSQTSLFQFPEMDEDEY